MSDINTKQAIKILYTNWRGETAERLILPVRLWFGTTEWHKHEQWLLRAVDIEKDAERDFALKDIHKFLD
jgi:predicted DNA-binding transcriptional regulator YafY